MWSGWSSPFKAILVVDPLSFTAQASRVLLGFDYITGSPCSIDIVGVRLIFTTLPSSCHIQVGEILIISSTAAPLKVPDGIRIVDLYYWRCADRPARRLVQRNGASIFLKPCFNVCEQSEFD